MSEYRSSIAIVVAYFGKAPLGLPAFLLSCNANPDIRWFVYTDFDLPSAIPPNVTMKSMSLHDLGVRASEVFRIRIDLVATYPRKICDLKPAYGLIFDDDIGPFDFWACSDLDVVWGDLRRFLTPDLLAAHDIVSSRVGRLSGHFTLFRNTREINDVFQSIPGLMGKMTSPEYRGIDEPELTAVLRRQGSSSSRLRRLLTAGVPLMPRVYWRRDLTTDAAHQRASLDDPTKALRWCRGQAFGVDGRELMYLHLHKLEKYMHRIDFGFNDAPSAFAVTRHGFELLEAG